MFFEKKSFHVLSTLVLLTALTVFGCSSEVPKLVPPPTGPAPKPPEKVREGTQVNDVFTKKSVDILFVIDNSGSMGSKQSNLAANFDLFVDGLQGNKTLDWHIGVVTSTVDNFGGASKPCCGELVGDPDKFVTPKTFDWINVLKEQLLVGTDGSGSEEFFAPVKLALTPPMSVGVNNGFYRPNAFLSVIFVTDADDQGKDSPRKFWDFLKKLKGDPKKVLAYGAIIPSADRRCDRSSESPPAAIEEFFELANKENGTGLSFSLCAPDFGVKLTNLGADISKKVGEYLLLSRRPILTTIVVNYGIQSIPNDPKVGWVYDNKVNGLRFGPDLVFSEQPAGTNVTVNFEVAD